MNRHHPRARRSLALHSVPPSALTAASVWLGAALLGCSTDDTTLLPVEQSEPQGAAGSTAPAAEPPLYVLSTTVTVGDTDQGYLVPVSGIEPGASFDLEQGVEIDDSTIATLPQSGVGDPPYLYVGSSVAPTITRWVLRGDTLSPGPVLNLGNLGLTRAPVGAELMHSRQRAYIPDDQGRQVVVWDPEAMALVATIGLDVQNEGALQPSMSVLVRPDRVIVVVSWQGSFDDDWSVFGRRVRVFSIDPASNEIVSVADEERCNSMFWSSVASDGTAYFSPLSYYTPIRAMLGAQLGPDSCSLRVLPPGAAFDAGYEIDLNGLVGGRPAGTVFLVQDDVAFIRAWHADLVTPVTSDKSNWQDVINEAGFLWWRWQLGQPAATQIPDQDPGASEVTALYEVDGRKFLPRVAADYSSTTLDELDPAGALRPTLSGPGNIWGLVRLR